MLDATRAELERVNAELAARQAAIQAPLVAEQQKVDALRAEAAAMRERTLALTVEANVGQRDMPEASVLRLLLAVGAFVGAALSLPEHTVQVMIAGLVVAAIAAVRGLIRRD